MTLHKILYILASFLTIPLAVEARVTTMSGGISTGYDYSDRTYNNVAASKNDERSRLSISPNIEIVSESPRDQITFEYTPSLMYDFEESETESDHRLTAGYQRSITERWTFELEDAFVSTDEYNSYSAVGIEEGESDSADSAVESTGESLRDNAGRRRYYTNRFDFSTSYIYLEDSEISFDYQWRILRNDEDDTGTSYEDYDRHNLNLHLSRRLNHSWKVGGSAGYTRGIYETVGPETPETPSDDDLSQYDASLYVENRPHKHHTLSVNYTYNGIDYDQADRSDGSIHDLTAGWSWTASPRLALNVGGGPTYSKSDDESGEWNFNGSLGADYRLERGWLRFSAAAGNEFDNFSGTGERGTTEYWQAQFSTSYQLFQYTSISAYLTYRDESRDVEDDNGESVVDENRFGAGGSVNYRFSEHYVLSFSYGYIRQESDVSADEYDDHRFTIALTYQDDFFQW